MGLRNGALAYAPSATTHTGLPRNPSHDTAHRISSTASSNLVRNGGRCFGAMPARFFSRTYSRASSGRATTPHAGWRGEQPEDDPHVPVHERPAGRPGRRVVVDPGPLDVPPVPLGRGVVQGERQPVGVGHQRLDHLVGQVGGDEVGPLPGGRHRGVARAVLAAQPGGPDPTRDRPPAAGQDRPDEQPRQPRGGPRVEGGREAGKPVARRGQRVRGWHGRVRRRPAGIVSPSGGGVRSGIGST